MLLPSLLALSLAASHGTPTQPYAETAGMAYQEFDPLHETKEARDKRMKWFREARFGMFIHWGLYSVPAGAWNGKDVPGAGEWLQYDAKIKPADYEPLQQQFNPVNFDAKKWVSIAKNAGMKYIVITSKHHEGFGMWPSKQGTWNIGHTQFHRDPLKELAAECKRQGLTLCFYHSIMDWHEPDYLPRRPWDDRPTENANMDRYVAYMKAQLKELLTEYGPIGILWFDGEWEDTWTHERGVDLYKFIRTLQPNIIVNNRVDTGRSGLAGNAPSENVGDYGTPEQTIPANGIPGKDWETCMTMNDTWGFHATDHNWKSPETLIRNLVDIASKGGNYLLNVGPTSLGEIPPASVDRLEVMGKWTKANGDSLYDTTASPFPRPLSWGRVTQKPGKLYLHVFDPTQPILLPGLKTPIKKVYELTNHKVSFNVAPSDLGPKILVDQILPDKIDTVLVAEIDGTPEVVPTLQMSEANGNIKLDGADAETHGDNIQYESNNRAIGYWTNSNASVSWKFREMAAGNYSVTLDLACEPGSAGGTFTVSVGDQTITGTVPATKSWQNFVKLKLDNLTLPSGDVELTVKPTHMTTPLMNLRSITLTKQ